ncbi:MAG: PQQ-binding-like beta-propeller repeat protein [Thaumarchaeota archaeon]|nr:PQQ-binding-like beta-propeller repeat protein [Nitrososphaerota archaeon]MCL5318221.1 PQQ-binding-like beta-propeller repeat protein [Nitrososphaerota archaeon]
MSSSKQNRVVILSVLVILAFGTFAPTLAYAAPLANTAKDWQYVNGNSWAQNYSPETQITKSNVDQLEVKWIFPLQGASDAVKALQSLTLRQGSTTPPVVAGGKVYVTTNYLRTYAVDAKNGKQLWAHDYSINMTDLQKRLPVVISTPHLHGIRYWEAGNAILLSGMACDFYGIDATTGKTSFWVKDLCKDVPGNVYIYHQGIMATSSQANVGTYEKGKQFIFVVPGAIHSSLYDGDGRHVTLGIDQNTKQIAWRVFSFPPQDKPTKDWALQECSIGFFQATPCSQVAAKAPQNLEWDWAQPDQLPSRWGGVTANWGQPVVDEDTGILYTNTGNQGPYSNVTMTPGPRLYGSTIMAIDMNAGKRVWWLQPFPRDPYDYDCNWSGLLADVPKIGKVYMKGCKEGMLYVMDAKTGKPYYVKDVIAEQVKLGQVTTSALKEPYQGGNRYHLSDPFSTYDMREMKAPDGSKYCGSPCPIYPYFYNGIFGTDMTYDPETGTLFQYALGLQAVMTSPNYNGPGSVVNKATAYPVANTTIIARDAATSDIKWTYFNKNGNERAAMIATPELLITGSIDGVIRIFDKTNGKVLKEVSLGSDVKVGLTTGQDSDGNQKVFALVGAGQGMGAISPTSPMTLVAVGLSNKAAPTAQTSTVTTTQSTTVTTTAVSTTTSATTVTSTSATTVTSQVTQTETQTSGLPSEVTYAAIGVAVIAIIAAAVLVMRKK